MAHPATQPPRIQVLVSGRTWGELSPAVRSSLQAHSCVLGCFKLKGVEVPQEVVHVADDLLGLRPYLAPRWGAAEPAAALCWACWHSVLWGSAGCRWVLPQQVAQQVAQQVQVQHCKVGYKCCLTRRST
jgi:hypothetical protein